MYIFAAQLFNPMKSYCLIILFVLTAVAQPSAKTYMEKHIPTPNYAKNKTNEVLGIVLHHTAQATLEESLEILTSPEKKASTHVVIDTDGTRYIMAEPNVVTYHAGLSIMNGREHCNYFTVGIEFQGNTLETPLTDDQIASGIQYVLPIMEKYHIPWENIVTHGMIRTAYIDIHPEMKSIAKIDITLVEYTRFMQALLIYKYKSLLYFLCCHRQVTS